MIASRLKLSFVHFVEKPTPQVPVIGLIWRLGSRVSEERREQWCMCVEQIHRRKPKQIFHGVDHAYGRVEVMINERLFRAWRILADHQGNRAVGINVVGSILRIVLHDSLCRFVVSERSKDVIVRRSGLEWI